MNDELSLRSAAMYYRKFCECVGIDVNTPDTKDTPLRVAKLFLREYTSGLKPRSFDFTTFKASGKDLVSVTGMRFVSICSHHHLPMSGYAHFSYLPHKRIAGLSKIPRLIQWVAKQPSVQEELTHAVLKQFITELQPYFAALTLTASHSCMSCRGIGDYEARMTTSALFARGGRLGRYESTKAEAQAAIDLWYKSRAAMA